MEKALTRAAQIGGMHFVGCLHVGPVIYGNIGSPDRLDFTVVGPTVNFLILGNRSKERELPAVCSQEFAASLPAEITSRLGIFALKGIPDEQTIFKLLMPNKRT